MKKNPLELHLRNLQTMNCWELKKCEREPDGQNAEKLCVCEASGESKFDGIELSDGVELSKEVSAVSLPVENQD